MSIEQNIESIAASLASIAASLASIDDRMKYPSEQAFASPAPVIPPATLEQAIKVPEVPYVTPAPAAPTFAPPAFAAPEPAPAAIVLPFADTAGFTQYLIASFQKLEAKAPGTGGKIQLVIESLGCKNVNEVQPGSWVTVYTEVEKLVA